MRITKEISACKFEDLSWDCEYFWERVHEQNLEDALDSYCEVRLPEFVDIAYLNNLFLFRGDEILNDIGYVKDEYYAKSNVVAAMCCKWCKYCSTDGDCTLLGFKTYPTDTCDNFKQKED